MRRPDGWYEEDSEWCLPFVALEAHIRATGAPHALEALRKDLHVATFRNGYPDAYEQFYNTVLRPGESRAKDERLFYAIHQDDWLAIAAWGDWKEGVPEGMVLVLATQGGRREHGIRKRCFLIPEEEYDPLSSTNLQRQARQRAFAFVVDPARHQEVVCP